jgi:putative hydrolase of the HAD superfamily
MVSLATPRIQLVIFDLGRVLIRICDGWDQACRRAGVEIQLEQLDPSALQVVGSLSRKHEVGQIDLEGFAREASPALGITPDQFRAIATAYLHQAFPGTVELLADLRSSRVATACLSNTNESHWRMMNDPSDAAHIPLDRLNHRFASHLVQARKPDAAIYEHVERETRIAPGSILFFDDVPENVEAAIQRGWNAWHVDPRFENPIPHIREQLCLYRALE